MKNKPINVNLTIITIEKRGINMLLSTHSKDKSMYQILIEEIEQTRTLMIQTAVREGMTSPNTLQISQSLDALLNKLQIFFYQ